MHEIPVRYRPCQMRCGTGSGLLRNLGCEVGALKKRLITTAVALGMMAERSEFDIKTYGRDFDWSHGPYLVANTEKWKGRGKRRMPRQG